MAPARAIRTFLAVLLVAAQFATGALAAQMTAEGAPCPVHAALASTEDHASAHRGHHDTGPAGHAHGSGHDHPGSGDDSNTVLHFNSACCAACAAAVTSSDPFILAPDWTRRPPLPAAQGLEPGELPSTDPPPRILL